MAKIRTSDQILLDLHKEYRKDQDEIAGKLDDYLNMEELKLKTAIELYLRIAELKTKNFMLKTEIKMLKLFGPKKHVEDTSYGEETTER